MSYNALTIARYIVNYCNEENIPITNLKLQKLLYYAWIDFYKHTGRELFFEDFRAWQLGPVVPEVYYEYCPFGGTNIDRKYSVELENEDEHILLNFVSDFSRKSVSGLVNRSHAPGGAWDRVYEGGEGNRALIPFDLVRQIECE